MFSYPLILAYILGAKKNRLIETVLSSNHNICFGREIRQLTKVSKGAKIRIRYNQVPHLTQDTSGKVTNSHLDTTNESQEVSPFPAGDHKAHKACK